MRRPDAARGAAHVRAQLRRAAAPARERAAGGLRLQLLGPRRLRVQLVRLDGLRVRLDGLRVQLVRARRRLGMLAGLRVSMGLVEVVAERKSRRPFEGAAWAGGCRRERDGKEIGKEEGEAK